LVDSRRRIALSFDVEEWFQTHAAQTAYPREEWDSLESRVSGNIRRIFSILDDAGARATFFFLGWIVDRYPVLAREAHERGHEVASHGYSHTPLTSMDSDSFARELELTEKAFEGASVPAPTGFRAPSFTLVDETLWALDVLLSAGYGYDSSVYPMFRHRYGMPGAPVVPFTFGGGDGRLLELPMAVALSGRRRIPVAGGAYLRFMPFLLYSRFIERVTGEDRVPVLYLHPWELDRGGVLWRSKLRQRVRQGFGSGPGAERKLRTLLGRYRSVTLADLASEVTGPPEWDPRTCPDPPSRRLRSLL
jgi:polysaccharide deacetylase family protein (PEP-CTERM system associated)